MAGGSIVSVTDATFDKEILKSEKPVLVDFWAPWCGPCRAIGPIVETLAEEYGDSLKVAKVNVDDSAQTAASHNVRSIPTLILFKNGAAAETIVGLVSKDKIKGAIDKVIGS
ncbi:MAG: thioredoxin [Deltaproteobacteria bacterium]|nr:thioredoxin [Deltaproteobacteria bacterium]